MACSDVVGIFTEAHFFTEFITCTCFESHCCPGLSTWRSIRLAGIRCLRCIVCRVLCIVCNVVYLFLFIYSCVYSSVHIDCLFSFFSYFSIISFFFSFFTGTIERKFQHGRDSRCLCDYGTMCYATGTSDGPGEGRHRKSQMHEWILTFRRDPWQAWPGRGSASRIWLIFTNISKVRDNLVGQWQDFCICAVDIKTT